MKLSRMFGETLRETPTDIALISYQLLLRAGYIRQLASGLFSYLPLGRRSMRKIQKIIAHEIESSGGQEISLPMVKPAELWQRKGRRESMDEEVIRFKDQRSREMILAPTHEETAAVLAASEIHSYRQLPQLIFQFQPKFCNEVSPRGGLMRTREFITADAYSFDRDQDGLEVQYQALYNAFQHIVLQVGLPVITAISEAGSAEKKRAHEFIYLSLDGEESVAFCKNCGYAAKLEVAEFVKNSGTGELGQTLEKVHTPGTASIEALSEFLGIQKQQTAKAVFYMGEFGTEKSPRLILAMVRGDMEANEHRIKLLTKARKLRPAEEEEIRAVNCVPGFASPIGIKRQEALVVVDELVTKSANLVTGANETDFHLLNSNCYRDYQPDLVGNISVAYEGAPCFHCEKPLELVQGSEVGSLHQWGTYFTEIFDGNYLDDQGKSHPVWMGAYRISLNRLLACIVEEHHDDYGLCLPISVAPYQVILLALKGSEEVNESAKLLYDALLDAGIEVLYDDRDLSPGVKFNDADLWGIPLRLTISERSLKNGGIELKLRTSKERQIIPANEVVSRVTEEINNLKADICKRTDNAPLWQKKNLR